MALVCRLPGTFYIIQHPRDLGAREIGIEQQTGNGIDPGLMAGGLQALALAGRPAVLPDDGAVDRLARPTIPDDHGFALVCDPDGGDVSNWAT